MDVDLDLIKPRKRDPNFTADEKVLLAHLIQQFPIIEAKLVDGKSILRKKQAWKNVTQQFNAQVNVHKRDSATLKRAWDNLKAATRKARASKGGNSLKNGSVPILPSEREAIISIVEEVMISRVKENNDNDREKLKDIPSPCHMVSVELEDQESENSHQVDPADNLTMVSIKLEREEDEESPQANPAENITSMYYTRQSKQIEL
ncbi:uncharacterized protein LOC121726908 [Aricia agestis]|uniref:uncharacterized protein LOC121726908 n=1 Tax=Aricia agestis TaxID=91739 RepID=UPI001C205E6E|nr:uncharacterized protein LOC121726908 [Aricia agestis]